MCLGAYESEWFQNSVSMQRKIVQIIFRSQKPEVIRINGILPALSLRYYAGVKIIHCMFLCIIIEIFMSLIFLL